MNRRRNDKSKRAKSKRARASEVVTRRNVYLIVDGYNLMHVTRFKPLTQKAGALKKCREGLLALLAGQLSQSQYREVTIVFDSRQAPKRLPARQRYQHLDVVFARDENTADDLIAKMVQEHAHWQQLVVVSSDHRVQNAARRRKVTMLDSDEWFDALLEYESPAESAGAAEASPPTDAEHEFENPFPKGYFDDLNEE